MNIVATAHWLNRYDKRSNEVAVLGASLGPGLLEVPAYLAFLKMYRLAYVPIAETVYYSPLVT